MAYGSQEVAHADGAWAPTVDPSIPELSFLGQPQWDLYSDAFAYRPRTALDDYSEAMGCGSNPMPYAHLRECADAANTTVQEMVDRTVQMFHTLKPTKIGVRTSRTSHLSYLLRYSSYSAPSTSRSPNFPRRASTCQRPSTPYVSGEASNSRI